MQEGFDIDFAKQNVGNVLRAMVFERLIAEGVRTYDFLAGVSRHKQSWSDSVPNDLVVRAFRRNLLGTAGAWLCKHSKEPESFRQVDGRRGRLMRAGSPSTSELAGLRTDCPVVVLNTHHSGLAVARDLAPLGVRVIGLTAVPQFPATARDCWSIAGLPTH